MTDEDKQFEDYLERLHCAQTTFEELAQTVFEQDAELKELRKRRVTASTAHLESLCIYDPRNPHNVLDRYNEDEHPEPRTECTCDNCVCGRDVLAFEIELLKQIGCQLEARSANKTRDAGASETREIPMGKIVLPKVSVMCSPDENDNPEYRICIEQENPDDPSPEFPNEIVVLNRTWNKEENRVEYKAELYILQGEEKAS